MVTTNQPHILVMFERKADVDETTINKLNENYTIFVSTLEDDSFDATMSDNHISNIITVGNSWQPFNETITKYGNKLNTKWIHKSFDEFSNNDSDFIKNLFIHSNISNQVNNTISVYITAYNSGNIIYRPYNSLLAQTYKNWELVIIDDSDDGNNETELIVKSIKDFRVKYFRGKHSGFIGEVKNYAARLCTGYVICEVDHDDELEPDILNKLHKTYQSDENIGFVCSDCCELYDDNGENSVYGDNYSFGYGSYINEWHRNKWRAIAIAGDMNITTIKDIVGVPNHIRTWRASTLAAIGFNNSSLYASDDYDVILRTVIHCSKTETKMVHLPVFGYYQYRNRNIGNHTFKRNKEIRNLQSWSYVAHGDNLKVALPKLQEKLYPTEEKQCIGDNFINGHWNQIWNMPWNWKSQSFNQRFNPDDNYKVSIVISTYKRPELLDRAIKSIMSQIYQNFEIIVIGDACPLLNDFMNNYKEDKTKIRWWNMKTNSNDGGTTPKNYALRSCVRTNLICYLDDDNIYTSNHLETLVNKFKEDSNISFAFSSFSMGKYDIICKIPKKYRIDTSTFMHRFSLLRKYGYWRSHKDVGYAHDHELVSRWVKGGEKWAATESITMIYNMDAGTMNNAEMIYLYGDREDFV